MWRSRSPLDDPRTGIRRLYYKILPSSEGTGPFYSQIGLIMTCHTLPAPSRYPRRGAGRHRRTQGRADGDLALLGGFSVSADGLHATATLMLLGCVALVGFGNSLWHPTAIPTLARRFPERKGLVLSPARHGRERGRRDRAHRRGGALAVLSWRECDPERRSPES